MPNKENIHKWVEALESGKFKQIQCALETQNGNCCLGVACRVAMENGVPVDVQEHADYISFDGKDGNLPQSVQNWLGIPDSDPRLEGRSATSLNDIQKLTFPEIAGKIRKQYGIQ